MDLGLDVRLLSATRAVIAARGRMNAMTAPAMKARIKELIESGRTEIVCDLGEVTFVDSSGLSALVTGLKTTRDHGGFLKVAAANEKVARIFKLTMLDRVFEMHASVDDALA
jgi:anti-sigma B factor antagonist